MSRWSGLRIVVVGLCAAVVEPAVAQSVLLTPRLEPGRSVYVEIKRDVTQTMSGGSILGKGINTHLCQLYGVIQTVESVSPNGQAKLRLRFDRILRSIKNDKISNICDTDVYEPSDTQNMMSCLLGPMIGQTLTMDVNSQGHVTKFGSMDAIFKKVEDSIEKQPNADDLRAKLRRLNRSLNDDTFKILWGDSRLALYAYAEVTVGDDWQRVIHFTHPFSGEMLLDFHCKVISIGEEKGRQVAVVGYQATLAQAPNIKLTPTSHGATLEKISGTYKGNATFDVPRGEFVIDRSTGRINIELKMPAASSKQFDHMVIDQLIHDSTRTLTMAQREEQKRKNANRQDE